MVTFYILCFSLLLNTNFIHGAVLRHNNNLASTKETDPELHTAIDIPAEPFNPSEYDTARQIAARNNPNGSRPYTNEVNFEKSLLNLEVRNGLVYENTRWPKVNDYAVIPYVISSKFSSNERLLIVKAFEDFHDNTCIQFVPRVNQRDYIHILPNGGCDSDAGRVGGEQILNLGEGCVYTDVAIHELNHAVGFWHEQNRPDRDNYITIYLENVIPGMRFNFDKFSSSKVNAFGQKYDTNSIMHYDKYAFSKQIDKLVVMEPKVPNPKMGLAIVLSKSDIEKINKMYRCSNTVMKNNSPPKKKPKISNNLFLEYELNECLNTHENCTIFAELDNGNTCKTNPWMKVNCRQACSLCEELCKDASENCADWALSGKCDLNPEYMHVYCNKSCFGCST